MSILLSIGACCCVGICVVLFLQPVIDFIHKLQAISMVSNETTQIIFKIVGISLIAEISCLICQDAGQAALGKLLQTSATILILWTALPLFSLLLDFISQILAEL